MTTNLKSIILFGLILCFLSSCNEEWKIANLESNTIRFEKEKEYPIDEEIDLLIEPYRRSLSDKMDIVIGTLVTDLEKGRPECTMGNWLADLLKDQAETVTGEKVDFAVQNYGGMRVSSVSSGPFLVGEAFEIMPFDNKLIVVKTHGDTIRLLMNRIAEYGGWPISKEVRLTVQDTIAKEIIIGGKPLDDSKEYQFAVPDYVANGGDKCIFLEGTRRISTELFVRDAIVAHTKAKTAKGQNISAKLEGRIKIL